MPTRATASKPTASKRKPVSLTVVIDELQLILDLSNESPKDPRLAQLVADVKQDFAQALSKFSSGDELPDIK
jgi:hypothetical protein